MLVPGQTFSRQILQYMGSLDTSEVHGLRADRGYRVYIDKALEIAQAARADAGPSWPGTAVGDHRACR